jgi:hypothetical protein
VAREKYKFLNQNTPTSATIPLELPHASPSHALPAQAAAATAPAAGPGGGCPGYARRRRLPQRDARAPADHQQRDLTAVEHLTRHSLMATSPSTLLLVVVTRTTSLLRSNTSWHHRREVVLDLEMEYGGVHCRVVPAGARPLAAVLVLARRRVRRPCLEL